MDTSYAYFLTILIFLPALGALALAFYPKEDTKGMKFVSLVITLVVLAMSLAMFFVSPESPMRFSPGVADLQQTCSIPWIPALHIQYFLGMDGISFPLIVLTALVSALSMAASWNIEKHVKAYCMLFLILETGMLGVFLSLDFFLFYVFWEVMLLPMYFLIGVWGGPRREYAAIKFFLYTLLGSVLMLIAILMLYYQSDLTKLNKAQLVAAHVSGEELAVVQKVSADKSGMAVHTFNILALAQIGQHTDCFSSDILFGKNVQWWAFVLLLIGFVVKVPSVPVHTWLPDAHVEAPTPISMILAGVLLKMGGYGILRMCYPICPEAGYELRYVVCGLGVVSMIYGAFAALAQKDFKRLVAYSSVSHMGYVVLGIGAWAVAAGPHLNADSWMMGVNAAMFQMIAHGISSPGMFFMVGIIYDRVHHRNLDQFGGLFARMPVYAGLAMVLFFAGLGLPGLCGFWGEAFVTLSAWNLSKAIAVCSAAVVIITAAYILWTLQRVYLGAEYKGPHGDHLTPITPREIAIAAPLVALAIFLGVNPQFVFNYMTPTVNQTVTNLAEWNQRYHPQPQISPTRAAALQVPEQFVEVAK
jgi:NADH-quinone oxidoreductase subunit M